MMHMTIHTNRAFPIVLVIALSMLLQACQLSPSEPGKSPAPTTNDAILRYDSVHHPVIAQYGMVVSQNALATRVGQDILRGGGNAVDAAVAVGFALAVTLPRAGNLGGSGFMLIHLDGEETPVALDFRSVAPRAAHLNDFIDSEGDIDWDSMTFGPKAAGVPGTVAGLHYAWQHFGSLPWPQLLEPARQLAANGIKVSNDLAFALGSAMPVMSQYPSSLRAYSKGNDQVYAPGDKLVQADLAHSIAMLAEHGADAFYRGEIAGRIDKFMREEGGYIRREDLADYRVRVRPAIETEYRGYRVVTMPPSSTGGLALLQMLNVLQNFDLAQYPAGSADSLHLLAETMKLVAANRRINIGDPDFVDVPTLGMLSRAMAANIASEISMSRARPVKTIQPMDANKYESRETTHYSIVDGNGNAVSTTYTLGYSFGSGVVVPGTGILLDNQLRNFSHRQQGHANAMKPGKRMLSTMTPTMVFDPTGALTIVTGTPGGSRIHNVILQLLVNVIDYDMNIAEASNRPRIHQQWRTPQLGVERGIGVDTIQLLENRGHIVQRQQTMGSTQSIVRQGGYLFGAADPRRPDALALGVNEAVP